MYYTTLNKIRGNDPCCDGWANLLKTLNKTKPDDEVLSLKTILESNGIDDAIWCLRAVDNIEKEARLYAVWCARQVQHLMTDERSIHALNVAEKFANGEATEEELAEAAEAAGAAARDTDGAAWEAAWAARAAARAAAGDAAGDAAGAAGAAWAAGAAAGDAAGDAAGAAGAAWAAGAAAGDAAGDAWEAAWDAAWAARAAAWAAQKQRFIEVFCQE